MRIQVDRRRRTGDSALFRLMRRFPCLEARAPTPARHSASDIRVLESSPSQAICNEGGARICKRSSTHPLRAARAERWMLPICSTSVLGSRDKQVTNITCAPVDSCSTRNKRDSPIDEGFEGHKYPTSPAGLCISTSPPSFILPARHSLPAFALDMDGERLLLLATTRHQSDRFTGNEGYSRGRGSGRTSVVARRQGSCTSPRAWSDPTLDGRRSGRPTTACRTTR